MKPNPTPPRNLPLPLWIIIIALVLVTPFSVISFVGDVKNGGSFITSLGSLIPIFSILIAYFCYRHAADVRTLKIGLLLFALAVSTYFGVIMWDILCILFFGPH